MIVEFMDGIVSASGTLCKSKDGKRVIVTTRKAPSTNPQKVRMYIRSADSYQRTKPFSEKERMVHELFTKRQAYVKELMASGKYSRSKAWAIAKQTIQA